VADVPSEPSLTPAQETANNETTRVQTANNETTRVQTANNETTRVQTANNETTRVQTANNETPGVQASGSLVTTAWRVLTLRMEGDALQLWRTDANILNKQSRKPTRDGPPAWRLDVKITPKRKKISLLRIFKRGLGPGRIPWINDLSERKWT
jgi:hypothetical protein